MGKTRYIILIPHRDALKVLLEYRSKLFSAGIIGSHSFPPAALLAEVSRPFSRNELQELGRKIRALTSSTKGKVISGGVYRAESRNLTIFGPPLELTIEEKTFPEKTLDTLLYVFNPPVLCAYIDYLENDNKVCLPSPAFEFRAACLANLLIRPLGGAEYSFEWKISLPLWLPSYSAACKFGKL